MANISKINHNIIAKSYRLLFNIPNSSRRLQRLHYRYLTTLRYHNSIYFLKGNDSRKLNIPQQKQFADLIIKNSPQTSCLVFNPVEIERKLEQWYQKLPWIYPHYAVKANPINQLVHKLVKSRAGLDCASHSQIQAALQLGTPRNLIIYSNSIKDEDELRWAGLNGICLTTADTIDELLKIKKYAPNMRILWRISIHEEATDDISTHFSEKFGDDLESFQKMYKRMAQIQSLGINLKGIHFHCGSGHNGSSAFEKAVSLARNCLQIGRKYGHEMSILDVGGGFPSGDLAQATVNSLSMTRNDPLGYDVIAEPGRHFAAHSCYLLVRVLGKKFKGEKFIYHLNESLYHSFKCNLIDNLSFQDQDLFVSKINLKTKESSEIFQTRNVKLAGMTTDQNDIITNNISVPIDLETGDWLCFPGMGAYTNACKSNFNGIKTTEKIFTLPIYFESKSQQPAMTAMPCFD